MPGSVWRGLSAGPWITLWLGERRRKGVRQTFECPGKGDTMNNNGIRTEINMEEILAAGKEFFLNVGTPLQVEIEGITVRLNSICVGWLRDHYLIIKQPSTGFGSIASKLFNGNKITVRFINNGDIFAFQSEIMESSNSPRLIFVTYPKLVVRHSLRGSRRVNLQPSRGIEDRI